jgi:hypothetical protein
MLDHLNGFKLGLTPPPGTVLWGPMCQCPILPYLIAAHAGRHRAAHPRPPTTGTHRVALSTGWTRPQIHVPLRNLKGVGRHRRPLPSRPFSFRKSLCDTPSPRPFLPVHHQSRRTENATFAAFPCTSPPPSPLLAVGTLRQNRECCRLRRLASVTLPR